MTGTHINTTGWTDAEKTRAAELGKSGIASAICEMSGLYMLDNKLDTYSKAARHIVQIDLEETPPDEDKYVTVSISIRVPAELEEDSFILADIAQVAQDYTNLTYERMSHVNRH